MCPPDQLICETPDSQYSIPRLTATDNCTGSNLSVRYQITGETTRDGVRNDASGFFNIGVSIITWTVTDGCGNVANCVTTVNIVKNFRPTFEDIEPICQNTPPPPLPPVSLEGVPGTWNPAVINTSTAGSFIYTFIPNSEQCVLRNQIMVVVINPEIIPEFAQIGTLCQGSDAPILPSTSENDVRGTWYPEVISTSSTGTFPYTFTPDDGQCSTPFTMNVEVIPQNIPEFGLIGPLCQNSIAPELPLISDNGIAGTWYPSVINTSESGVTTYTFTPEADQCIVPFTMDIEVTPLIIPEFTQIGPLCQNSIAPPLPSSSDNGISGTWDPSIINTTTTGIFTFTFRPADEDCTVPVTMEIEVTSEIIPTFAQIGPLALDSNAPSLPSSSTEGIRGSWSPI